MDVARGSDDDLLWSALAPRLAQALVGPLPGSAAQCAMAPRPRHGWEPGRIPPGLRAGAGLVLLFPRDDRPHCVLTVRDEGLPNHAGQVSFPGGAVDEGESLEDAALREAHEEIGLDGRRARLIGRLSPLHVPVSGFALHPVVALHDGPPRLQPNHREVARILEAALERLGARESLGAEWRESGGRRYAVPFFRVDGEKVWGATAMVLAELLSLLGRTPRPPRP